MNKLHFLIAFSLLQYHLSSAVVKKKHAIKMKSKHKESKSANKSSSDEESQFTDESSSNEEYSVTRESSSNEESSVTNESSSNEEYSVTKESSSNEEHEPVKKHSSKKKSPSSKKSSFDEESLTNFCFIESAFQLLKNYKDDFKGVVAVKSNLIQKIFTKIQNKASMDHLKINFARFIKKLETNLIEIGEQNDTAELISIFFDRLVRNENLIHSSFIKKFCLVTSTHKRYKIQATFDNLLEKIKIHDSYLKKITFDGRNLKKYKIINVPEVIVFRFLFNEENSSYKFNDTFSVKDDHIFKLKTDMATFNYKLTAISTHIGASNDSGHYVTIIKEDDSWVKYSFNQRKKLKKEEGHICKVPVIFIYERLA
ncbi:hypothetical protein H311_01672 [Anncaliia algerae PRA109]|nr:hypothetical protein H311_01672 [Anncaliia algerae PRA109]